MIDIIIPIYNTDKNILLRCLNSIYMQTEIDKINVILVNDGGNTDYDDIIAFFNKHYRNIILIGYKDNKGPAYARQYGIDNSFSPYFMFIDSDDTLATPISVKVLLDTMLEDGKPKSAIASTFYEIAAESYNSNHTYLLEYKEDFTWLFGKLYNRDFINKYQIKFLTDYKSNEDAGFNSCIKLCCDQNYPIIRIDDITYYWHNNTNSITRKDNSAYSFGNGQDDCFCGYCKNMEYAILFALERGIDFRKIESFAYHCLCNIYLQYIENQARAPHLISPKLSMAQEFYNNVFHYFNYNFNLEYAITEYNIIMKSSYDKNKLWNIIPQISFFDFLNQIK